MHSTVKLHNNSPNTKNPGCTEGKEADTITTLHPQSIKSLSSTDPQAKYSPMNSHQHNKSTATTKGAGGESHGDSRPIKTISP